MDPGRLIALIGGLVGVSGFVYLAALDDADLWSAFVKAMVAAVLAMGALGIAERFWRGKKLAGAEVSPTGGSITFENEIANVTDVLNERLSTHVATINSRLDDLEEAVFEDRRER
jgi:hypothetical protein